LLKLIKRQTNSLTVEFCIIQERQLAKPSELAVAIRKETSKPIWNRDVNNAFTIASIENNGVNGMKGHDQPPYGWSIG
jgi:hypothetical protein